MMFIIVVAHGKRSAESKKYLWPSDSAKFKLFSARNFPFDREK